MVSVYAFGLLGPAAHVPRVSQYGGPKRDLYVIIAVITLCRNKLLAASTGFWTVVVCIS